MDIPTADTEPLEFTSVAQGDNGPEEAVAAVLRDQPSFADFFQGEPPTGQPVDWDTEVVTVVALGQRRSWCAPWVGLRRFRVVW